MAKYLIMIIFIKNYKFKFNNTAKCLSRTLPNNWKQLKFTITVDSSLNSRDPGEVNGIRNFPLISARIP